MQHLFSLDVNLDEGFGYSEYLADFWRREFYQASEADIKMNL